MTHTGDIFGIIATIAIIILVLVLVLVNIRVVPQARAYVIERLGAYKKTWGVGLHVKLPFVDRIAASVSLKEDFLDFEPSPVITKDNVTIMIDTVVFYQITDPKLYTYGISNPKLGIANLSTTTLRNIIGDLELDQTLTSRDIINSKMRVILDEATDAWGIKVNRVELKNINPPVEIQNAMERQMKAERERRENILRAEGEKKAAILVAEGNKESMILNAEAEKAAAILQAEAKKEATIKEAQGEGEAILTINKAYAEGLSAIKAVNPDAKLIALKSLETMEKVADGKATKLIIPSELQNLTALGATLKEVMAEDTPKK